MRPHLVLGLALVVGCGSFSEGRDPPATSIDAGDGGNRGPSDADVSSDGGDGSVDVDGGIPPPKTCAELILCDDFERTPVADPRWTDVIAEGGATIAITTAQPHGGTRSLAVQLPESVTTDRRARLEKSFTPKARRVTARFSLFPALIAPDGDVLFARMRTEQGQVFLMFQDEKLALAAGTLPSGNDSAKSDTSLGVGQWYDVVFDYRAGLNPKATVLIGTATLAIDVTAGGGDVVAFELGAVFAQAGGSSTYYIDDVSIDRGL